MSAPENNQDFQVLERYASGFMVSQVLFSACELGVFDILASSPEPLDVSAMAARLCTCPRATALLLDACVALGLLHVEEETGTAVYANTALSHAYLTSHSPMTQHHMMAYLAGTPYRCWAHLADAVRTGCNQYPAAVGMACADPFSAIYRCEQERLRFLRGLQDVWRVCGRWVLSAFDLSPFTTICDLGGGSGALARTCAALYPACHVTVMDVPDVVSAARTHFGCPDDGRVDFCEGDFFRDPLPKADAFILARVLHDWPDAKCLELLSRVHGACNPGGAVLVVESLLDKDGRGPLRTLLLSLNMLLQTEGQERSPQQYDRLLTAAGFRDVHWQRTGGAYDVVFARK